MAAEIIHMEVETEARGEEAEIAGGAGRSTRCVELDFDPLAKAGRVCVADGGGIAERL